MLLMPAITAPLIARNLNTTTNKLILNDIKRTISEIRYINTYYFILTYMCTVYKTSICSSAAVTWLYMEGRGAGEAWRENPELMFHICRIFFPPFLDLS